ncbi:MAG: tetratricopeptide repeat protein [Parvularculaceae bacterium]
MFGVGLDELKRRDAQRRARVLQGVGALAASIIAPLSATTFFALEQRKLAIAQQHEAERQQHQAERLIDFMLTGLREKLEPLGKLDILDDVADQALDYYDSQDLSALDGDSLNRRARALMFAGAVLQRRGELDNALKAFQAAKTTTSEQLRREPNIPERIFDHAQSVFYVADVANNRGDFNSAESGYQEYYRLAKRLVTIDPKDENWQLELAYATNNLGSARYRSGKFDEAADYFQKSVEIRRSLFRKNPENKNAAKAYAYALSWNAYNELSLGQFQSAIDDLRNQIDIYSPILKTDPDNFPILDKLVTARRRLGEAQIALGDLKNAASDLDQARLISTRVLQREPDDKLWLGNSVVVEIDRSELFTLLGDDAAAAKSADRAIELAQAFPSGPDGDRDDRSNRAIAYARRVVADDLSPARDQAAKKLSDLVRNMISSPHEYRDDSIGESCIALASYNRDKIGTQELQQLINHCRDTLVAREGILSADSLASLFILFCESGDETNATRIANSLDKMGFRRPDYLNFRESLQIHSEQ